MMNCIGQIKTLSLSKTESMLHLQSVPKLKPYINHWQVVIGDSLHMFNLHDDEFISLDTVSLSQVKVCASSRRLAIKVTFQPLAV